MGKSMFVRTSKTKTNNKDRNKSRRKMKWELDREKWKNNKDYQKEQKERLDKLQNKAGYEVNLLKGIENKEQLKKQKAKKKYDRRFAR